MRAGRPWYVEAPMVGVVLLMSALLIALALAWVSSWRCDREWKYSGMTPKWGFIQGCMLQKKDGTWIPAQAYRDIP